MPRIHFHDLRPVLSTASFAEARQTSKFGHERRATYCLGVLDSELISLEALPSGSATPKVAGSGTFR
jgi:hypothetical protein